MVKFEIKKVFLRRGNQIAVALLAVLLCVWKMYFSIILEEGQVSKMVKFEIKKVFLRRGNQIAVALLAVLLCVVCLFAGNISYVNESGETETGFQAVKKLREEQKEWAGFLDEVKIRKVIEENNKISQTPEAKSEDFQENDKAFHKKQGFQEIRNLLNYAYAEGFRRMIRRFIKSRDFRKSEIF